MPVNIIASLIKVHFDSLSNSKLFFKVKLKITLGLYEGTSKSKYITINNLKMRVGDIVFS